MHTLSVRALRSAALGIRKAPLATQSGRLFHASARVRAADDSGSAPQDGENKPENETKNTEGDQDKVDENLFGDSLSTATDETHGRKKAGNSSKSRTIRNRGKPEELPSVNLPKSFLERSFSRFEDNDRNANLSNIDEADARAILEHALLHQESNSRFEKHIAYILEAAAWNGETLSEILESLRSGVGFNEELVHKKGDILVAAAFWSALKSAHAIHGNGAVDELFERVSISSSRHLFATLNFTQLFGSKCQAPHSSRGKDIIQFAVDDLGLQGHPISWFSPESISEITAFLRADLLIKAPKNVKLAELRRPVTLINFSDYSGYSVPHDVVRHIAHQLEADVLHLRAVDIAHIVGDYLGQDAVRAPGPISRLGYMVAIKNGRQPKKEDNYENLKSALPTLSVMVSGDGARKDRRSIVNELVFPSNRGKSEDLWEDLKINTAIEELINSAVSKSTGQRPLLVHIDDFNALNMDSESGSMVISKIQKTVDGLWTEGRQIALVGSCSTKNASRSYANALRDFESIGQVVHLSRILTSTSDTSSASQVDLVVKQFASNVMRDVLEKKDYIRENDRNITKVLSTMVEYPPDATITNTGEMGLSGMHRVRFPNSWTNSILPIHEVYRIATLMIGHLQTTNYSDVFNIKTIERVVSIINTLEDSKEGLSQSQTPEENDKKDLWNMFRPPSLQANILPGGENNYEDRLESGLVDAQNIRTTFDDIHAPKETIESIKMLTTLSLIRPEAFSYGVLATDRIPGCLLYGPPGTGKTLLAKAVAKESGANMIEISGATINNKFVGESEKNVRALFQLAKKKEPLVIFIDEADALLGSRGHDDSSGNVGLRRETINQFLREWDGMEKTKAFIMVATNRPFDLDEAVLRRLPRKILIDLPTEEDRAAILRIHLRGEEIDPTSVSIEDLAKRTPLYSGSDLKNLCVAAAMAAVKEELDLEEKLKRQRQNGDVDGNEHGGYQMKRRVLRGPHFDKALREIAASVNEDMATLTAIRKFDEKYGDGGAARRRRAKGMGFRVVPEGPGAGEGRIRGGR
ncbi:AAA-domain-containing protein [Rostrohypoxylon terebratum]|nr:AAA-domain-containing protein [Rostrohypoxylon terebratum]